MGARAEDDVSRHAHRRGSQRGIRRADIEMVLGFGRCVHRRKAWIYVVGRAELRAAARTGVDLSAVEGIHVLVAPAGDIMTVYRNHTLNLKPARRRRPRRRF